MSTPLQGYWKPKTLNPKPPPAYLIIFACWYDIGVYMCKFVIGPNVWCDDEEIIFRISNSQICFGKKRLKGMQHDFMGVDIRGAQIWGARVPRLGWKDSQPLPSNDMNWKVTHNPKKKKKRKRKWMCGLKVVAHPQNIVCVVFVISCPSLNLSVVLWPVPYHIPV